MTFLFCVVFWELDDVRQKGDAELCAVSQGALCAHSFHGRTYEERSVERGATC